MPSTTANPKSTGKLHTELALGIDRKQFDAYLDALARAGLIQLIPDTFTNPEGREITFKRASLTHEGPHPRRRRRPQRPAREVAEAPTKSKSGKLSSKPSTATRKAVQQETQAAYTPAQKDLEAPPTRMAQSRSAKTGKPAFIVFSDAILQNIVTHRPAKPLQPPANLRHRP